MPGFFKSALILLVFFMLTAVGLSAEDQIEEDNGFRWSVIPAPLFNPSLGMGIQILPIFLYPLDKADTISPPSSTSGFLLFAKPDWDIPEWTVLGSIIQQFYIKQDIWRLSFDIGGASIVYKQYAAGNQPGEDNTPVWAILEGFFTSTGVKRKIWSQLYGGLNYNFQYYQIRGRTATDQTYLDAMGFP